MEVYQSAVRYKSFSLPHLCCLIASRWYFCDQIVLEAWRVPRNNLRPYTYSPSDEVWMGGVHNWYKWGAEEYKNPKRANWNMVLGWRSSVCPFRLAGYSFHRFPEYPWARRWCCSPAPHWKNCRKLHKFESFFYCLQALFSTVVNVIWPVTDGCFFPHYLI